MPLDVHAYPGSTDRPELRAPNWSIDERAFELLSGCWRAYARRTGRDPDFYGDLRLPPGTLAPLRDAIEEAQLKESNSETAAILRWLLELVRHAETAGRGSMFFGD